MNKNELWSSAVKNLSLDLPHHAINTWIDPIRAKEIVKNKIVLEVPNQFFLEWVDSHYKKTIDASVKKISKNNISVKFKVGNGVGESKKETEKRGVQKENKKVINKKPPSTNKGYVFDSFIEGANN